MRFIVFLVRFAEKKNKKQQILGNVEGPSQWQRDPLQRRRTPTPQQGREGGFFHPRVRGGEGLHRDVALFTAWKCCVFVLFCFVFPLF